MAKEKYTTDTGEKRFLMRQFNTWFVRLRVPAGVRKQFYDKKFLVRTLDTNEIKEARKLRTGVLKELRFMFELAARDADKFRQEELAALQRKHLRKRPAVGKMTAKEQAEFNRDRARAYELGSPEIAESLGVPSLGKPKTPLNHLEEEWFEAAALEYRTKIHYRHCRELLAQHLRREGLPECIESVDSKVALSFRKYLVAEKIYPTTGNSYLGGLRSRWGMLIREEVVEPLNPFAGVSMKSSRRGKEPARFPFSSEELVTLFTGDMEQLLFNVATLALCGGGMRRNEILARRCGDVEGSWLHVREGKGQTSVRRVAIASILRDGMARLMSGKAPEDFLIDAGDRTLNAKGNAVTGFMTAHLRDVMKITDPKKDGLHCLRHNWEQLAVENGVPWHISQAVLGHSMAGGNAVTAGYAHLKLLDVPKREAIETVVKALPSEVRKAIASKFGKL